jgi:hypothetical protein
MQDNEPTLKTRDKKASRPQKSIQKLLRKAGIAWGFRVSVVETLFLNLSLSGI